MSACPKLGGRKGKDQMPTISIVPAPVGFPNSILHSDRARGHRKLSGGARGT